LVAGGRGAEGYPRVHLGEQAGHGVKVGESVAEEAGGSHEGEFDGGFSMTAAVASSTRDGRDG
jgi:hypothetical protein